MIEIKNNTIYTANVIIYRLINGKYQFLIIQEHDGFWGFPGGSKDVGDKTLIDAAKRELKEELNILPDSYTIQPTDIIQETEYTDPKSDRYGKKGTIHMFLIKWGGKEIEPTKELKDVKWMTYEQAQEIFKIPENREILEKVKSLLNEL